LTALTPKGIHHAIQPLAIGVCSWSLQVEKHPELKRHGQAGSRCRPDCLGDPHHAALGEGEPPSGSRPAAGFRMTGAMLGFPGEDYTQTADHSEDRCFGNPADRAERLERFQWARIEPALWGSLTDVAAGIIPEPRQPDRKPFLDTLLKVSDLARPKELPLPLKPGRRRPTSCG